MLSLSRETLTTTLKDGAVAITLSEAVIESILHILHEEPVEVQKEESNSSDEEEDEEERTGLIREHERARFAAMGALPRNQRTRQLSQKASWWHATR